MNKDLAQQMQRVAEETIGSLAFLMPTGALDEPNASDPQNALWASVDFSGPFHGCLYMSLSPTILPTLAGNMLGIIDDTTAVPMQHDAFKELLNVVCGNLLPVMAGVEAVFEVGAPRLHQGQRPREVFQQQPPTAQTMLEIEGGQVELAMYVHASALPEPA